jgi:hypothetical protein
MSIVPTTGIWLNHINDVKVIVPSVEDLCSVPRPNGRINACIPATWASGTVTMHVTTPHGLSTGERVSVKGVVPDGFNVSSVPVTVIDAQTFSYAVSANPGIHSLILSAGVVTRLSTGATFTVGSGLPVPIGINITSGTVISIEDGTSEGNGVAVNIDKDSASIRVVNMDNEVNPLGDILTAGQVVLIENGLQNYIHVMNTGGGSAGQLTTVRGVNTGQITIDPGVSGAVIENNFYGNTFINGQTITDNGTNTTILNNRTANGGAFFPNKLYGMQISGDLSSMGFGVAPAPKSDDPNGYLPAFQTKSDFIRLGAGPRQFPTCDATHGHGDIWYDQGAPKVTGTFRVCVKDASDAWGWRILYADGAGFADADTFLTACTLKPAMGTACANAGCTSTIPVVTSVSISCPTDGRTLKDGVAKP